MQILVFMIALLLWPYAAHAQVATPISTPDPVQNITMGDIDADEYLPQFQYDDESQVYEQLGVQDSYRFSMLGTMPFDEQLPGDNTTALLPFSRASVTYPCTASDGTIPSNITGLSGVAGTWTYSQYKSCNGLSGSACAAAVQQKAYYSYTFSDLGRGSSIFISYLSFDGASTGDIAPSSLTFSSSSYVWAARLFYKNGSARNVVPNVALTPVPAGNWGVINEKLFHPKTIFQTKDPGVYGRYYIENIGSNQIGSYAVQIQVPAVIAKSFKPRVNVCAVRPSGYDPAKAATAVAQATNVALTATRQPTSIPATRVATPVGATTWDTNLQRMWENSREYFINAYHPNNELSYLVFYGASRSVPTWLLSAIRVRVYDYDYSLKRVGSQRFDVTYTCARSAWCTWRLSDLVRSYPAFNRASMIATVSCPIATNRICPPFNDDRFDTWFDIGDRGNSTKSSHAIMSLDTYRDDGGLSVAGTATAYKTFKTPTRTIAKTYTAVRTNTPLPTVRTATSINVGSTAAALTATAQTNTNRQTATAYARVVQTATAANATQIANVTNVVRTATAAIEQTQTVQAQITSVIEVTQTAIADWMATAQATQQVYIDTTKTAIKNADNGSDVIQQNTNEQIDIIDDVGDTVGPGEVIKVITEAATALDRGLDSSPCQGFPEQLGGYYTGAGDYAINEDLAQSLCEVQEWLDTDQTFVPFVRTILTVIFVLLFAMLILRIVRGFIK